MASEAKTSLVINGVDRTAGAFASIGARAAACGSQLKGMLGGALAAAGAYMGFSKISEGISELGHLSDIATKANTSVDELTKTATAMDVLGIQRMGIDEFAKALDYMQRSTGRVGMEGFYQTIQELAGIEDRAKRGQEAMRIFGRSGMEFMPLINGAENGIQALQGVIDVMPAITQAAATSGDNVADATGIITAGVKSIWLQALGAICGYFDSQFVGGVQEAALKACAYMEYFAKVSWNTVSSYFSNFGSLMSTYVDSIGALITTISNRGVGTFFSDMWNTTWEDWKNGDIFGKDFGKEYRDLIDEMDIGDRMSDALGLEKNALLADQLNEKLAKISGISEKINSAAVSASNSGAQDSLSKDATETAKKLPRITNKLIGAGSNEARKLSILGPTLQTETKKQTKLLEKIAKNTENAADKDAVELDVLDN